MTDTPLGPDGTGTRVRAPRRGFARAYGSSPVHLLGLLLSFTVALVAFARVYDADSESWWRYAIWFVGAAVVHDLVLFPAYAAIDRLTQGRRRLAPGTVNFVRVPLVLSGMLFLVFGSSILQRGEDSFGLAANQDLDPFLGRWLLLTLVLLVASGLLYALSRLRSARRA